MSDIFNKYARYYDLLEHLAPYRETLDQVSQNVYSAGNQTVPRILDLGMGTGSLVLRLAMSCYTFEEIIGIEKNEMMYKVAIEKLKNFTKIRTYRADLETFIEGIRHESFDVVTMTNVLYLLLEKRKVFKQVYAILRKGGKLILVEPAQNFKYSKVFFSALMRPTFIGNLFINYSSWRELLKINRRDIDLKHIFLSSESICQLLVETGFKIKKNSNTYAGQAYLIVCTK